MLNSLSSWELLKDVNMTAFHWQENSQQDNFPVPISDNEKWFTPVNFNEVEGNKLLI